MKKLKQKSLFRRLFFGFVLCSALIWGVIVVLVVTTALSEGKREATKTLRDYASQVMVVAREFPHESERLARAIEAVEKIELSSSNSEDDNEDDPEDLRIQLWLGEVSVRTLDDRDNELPASTGFREFERKGISYWGYVVEDVPSGVTVQVSADPGINANVNDTKYIFFFIPLLFCLPLLLIPAWFMARRGLQPIDAVVDEINQRVTSGELTNLSPTRYRELNPVVESTNSLMRRLDEQMRRERGFVADVAHELKTPLAIVKSNVGIVESSADPERKRLSMRDLNAGISRSDHLIQQLLRMARLDQEPGQGNPFRDLDLAEFVRERIIQSEPLAASRGLQFELVSPEVARLSTDVDAMAAIVDNLLDNAVKYSPEGGRIDIELTRRQDDSLVFTVDDEGPGINEADIEHVFGRFFRVDAMQADSDSAPVQGAGLGLSIVRQAAQRIGAHITLGLGHRGKGLRASMEISGSS